MAFSNTEGLYSKVLLSRVLSLKLSLRPRETVSEENLSDVFPILGMVSKIPPYKVLNFMMQ